MLLNGYKPIKVFRAHVDMNCRVGAEELFWKMPIQSGTPSDVCAVFQTGGTISFKGNII